MKSVFLLFVAMASLCAAQCPNVANCAAYTCCSSTKTCVYSGPGQCRCPSCATLSPPFTISLPKPTPSPFASTPCMCINSPAPCPQSCRANINSIAMTTNVYSYAPAGCDMDLAPLCDFSVQCEPQPPICSPPAATPTSPTTVSRVPTMTPPATTCMPRDCVVNSYAPEGCASECMRYYRPTSWTPAQCACGSLSFQFTDNSCCTTAAPSPYPCRPVNCMYSPNPPFCTGCTRVQGYYVHQLADCGGSPCPEQIRTHDPAYCCPTIAPTPTQCTSCVRTAGGCYGCNRMYTPTCYTQTCQTSYLPDPTCCSPAPTPYPVNWTPNPYYPAPSPYYPAPSPYYPAPSPYYPAPSPYYPAPSPYYPAPSPSPFGWYPTQVPTVLLTTQPPTGQTLPQVSCSGLPCGSCVVHASSCAWCASKSACLLASEANECERVSLACAFTLPTVKLVTGPVAVTIGNSVVMTTMVGGTLPQSSNAGVGVSPRSPIQWSFSTPMAIVGMTLGALKQGDVGRLNASAPMLASGDSSGRGGANGGAQKRDIGGNTASLPTVEVRESVTAFEQFNSGYYVYTLEALGSSSFEVVSIDLEPPRSSLPVAIETSTAVVDPILIADSGTVGLDGLAIGLIVGAILLALLLAALAVALVMRQRRRNKSATEGSITPSSTSGIVMPITEAPTLPRMPSDIYGSFPGDQSQYDDPVVTRAPAPQYDSVASLRHTHATHNYGVAPAFAQSSRYDAIDTPL